MKRRITIAMSIMALMASTTVALAQEDGGWISCMSVQIADGEVVGTNGDWLADGTTFSMPYTFDGDSIAFEFGDGSAQAFALTPEVIDATACEDGSVFLNERIPGQDPSWLEPEEEVEPLEPLEPETASATNIVSANHNTPTVDANLTNKVQALIDALITLRPF